LTFETGGFFIALDYSPGSFKTFFMASFKFYTITLAMLTLRLVVYDFAIVEFPNPDILRYGSRPHNPVGLKKSFNSLNLIPGLMIKVQIDFKALLDVWPKFFDGQMLQLFVVPMTVDILSGQAGDKIRIRNPHTMMMFGLERVYQGNKPGAVKLCIDIELMFYFLIK
jgi:hypothetical protein